MNERLRILIVEDNPADADFIHELLPQAGPLHFQVESAQRLSEALARLERRDIDLVLLDLGLPDSQGLQTFHELQKVAADIPVIVMTGNDDQELAMAAVRDGAQDYLVKGQISGRPLIRAVRYALARQKAAEALRQSEHKYRTLVENIPQMIFIKDRDARFVSVNDSFARSLHVRPEDIIGRTDGDFLPKELADKYHADDQRIMRTGRMDEFDEKTVEDGREIWIHTVKTPVRNELGQITGVFGIFWDISEEKRAEAELQKFNRALRLVSQCNLEMMHATDETALMQAVCRLAVEQGGYRMAWVGYAEHDEAKSVRVAADAGFVDGYLATANITWADVERGRGPTGTAIRSGKPVHTRNILADPAFAPWREAAIRRGYASSIALPMMNEGRCFGSLTVYAGEPDVFDAREIELLAGLANDVAFGIAALRHRAEHRRAEESLQASESRFRTLIEKSPVAISISRAGRTIYVNQKFLELYGYQSVEELAGRPIGDDLAPEFREMVMERAQRRARGETVPSEFEGVGQRNDGSQFPVHVNVSLVELPDGKASMAFLTDITERKQAERQMKEALDFNRTIISDAAVGIVAYNAPGQCVLANEAAAKILNGAAPRLLEQNFRQLVSWRASGLLQMAEEVLATKEPRQREAHLTTSFGREVWLASHFSHFIQNGEPHLLHIFIDATDKKNLETQFLRSQRMESLGTLAGGIAHDLNNVLAPILISIQLLREELTDPALKKLLDGLEINVNRGAELVQQVLMFGRGVKSDREIVHVQHIAHEIKDIVRETFPKSVEFQMEIARDLWPVSCDPTQIHQVLLNLCINARDAMPGGGKLSLRLENVVLDKAYAGRNPEAQPGPYVLISVQDTGMGMTAEVQEHMFEPFFTTKEQGKGTGLGLSTTLGIVKGHGGFILCASAPGKGSVFKVHLPASAATAAATSSKTTQMPRGHNELILVVDDEPVILEIAQATLTHFGYRVLPATNGTEAVEIYRKRRDEIAAVITDMAMPVMDGPATIIALQLINPDVKIIATSGFSSKMTTPGKSGAAFKHFIHKPYTSATLLQEIHAILHEDSTEESAPKNDKGRPDGK